MNMVAGMPRGEQTTAQGLEAALEGIAERLLDLLAQECRDLKANRLEALDDYARQKDLLLVDLARLSRLVGDPAGLPAQVRARLAEVKAGLEENRRLLARHLEASREFAAFIEDAIRRRSTDGTYSRKAVRPAGAGAGNGDDAAGGAAGDPRLARARKAYGRW